jgi:hypothetical protein
MERMEMLLFFTTKHLKRRILSKYDIPMSYISSIELTQVFVTFSCNMIDNNIK